MKTAEDYTRQINDRLMPHPYNLSRKQREEIKSLIREIQREAYNQATEDDKEKILTITGEDNPYPLRDVLKRLIWATEYLLHVKNYDGHQYEELGQCVRRAREIMESILKLKK